MPWNRDDENTPRRSLELFPLRREMKPDIEVFPRDFKLWPDRGADNLSRPMIGDAEDDLAPSFVCQSASVFGQAIKVVLLFPFLKLKVLSFESIKDLLKSRRDFTHVSNPSFLSIPTSRSSAENAASALSRRRFIASSTVSASVVTFGST